MFDCRSLGIYFAFFVLFGMEITSFHGKLMFTNSNKNKPAEMGDYRIALPIWQVMQPYLMCSYSNGCISVKIVQPNCSNGSLESADSRYVNISLVVKNCYQDFKENNASLLFLWLWGSTQNASEIYRCRCKTSCRVPTAAVINSSNIKTWLDIVFFVTNHSLANKLSVTMNSTSMKKQYLHTWIASQQKDLSSKNYYGITYKHVGINIFKKYVPAIAKTVSDKKSQQGAGNNSTDSFLVNNKSYINKLVKNRLLFKYLWQKDKKYKSPMLFLWDNLRKRSPFRKKKADKEKRRNTVTVVIHKREFRNKHAETYKWFHFHKKSLLPKMVTSLLLHKGKQPVIKRKRNAKGKKPQDTILRIISKHKPRRKRNVVDEAEDLAILTQGENARDKDKISEMIATDFASTMDIDKPAVSPYEGSLQLKVMGPLGNLKNLDSMVNDLKAEKEKEESLNDVSETIASKEAHENFHLKRLRSDIKREEKQLTVAEMKKDQAESDLLANTNDKMTEVLARRKADAEDTVKKIYEKLHKLKEEYRILKATTENTDKGTKRKLHGLVVIDPMWGDWSPWSKCSVDCGEGGFSVRRRDCDTLPDVPCDGINFDMRPCNTGFRCEAQWQEWGAWGPCSMTCGKGVRAKSRVCMTGDKEVSCKGDSSRLEKCNLPLCEDQIVQVPVSEKRAVVVSSQKGIPKAPLVVAPRSAEAIALQPYAWGLWGEWASCSKNCGEGRQIRVRVCLDESKTTLIRVMVKHCNGGSDAQSRSCMGSCVDPVYAAAAVAGGAALVEYDDTHNGAYVVEQGNGHGPRVVVEPTQVVADGSDKAVVVESANAVPVVVAGAGAVKAGSDEDENSNLSASAILFIVLLIICVVLIIIALCIWFCSRIDDLRYKKNVDSIQSLYNDGDDPFSKGQVTPVFGVVRAINKGDDQAGAASSGLVKDEENEMEFEESEPMTQTVPTTPIPTPSEHSRHNRKKPPRRPHEKEGSFFFNRKDRHDIAEEAGRTGSSKSNLDTGSSSSSDSSPSPGNDKPNKKRLVKKLKKKKVKSDYNKKKEAETKRQTSVRESDLEVTSESEKKPQSKAEDSDKSEIASIRSDGSTKSRTRLSDKSGKAKLWRDDVPYSRSPGSLQRLFGARLAYKNNIDPSERTRLVGSASSPQKDPKRTQSKISHIKHKTGFSLLNNADSPADTALEPQCSAERHHGYAKYPVQLKATSSLQFARPWRKKQCMQPCALHQCEKNSVSSDYIPSSIDVIHGYRAYYQEDESDPDKQNQLVRKDILPSPMRTPYISGRNNRFLIEVEMRKSTSLIHQSSPRQTTRSRGTILTPEPSRPISVNEAADEDQMMGKLPMESFYLSTFEEQRSLENDATQSSSTFPSTNSKGTNLCNDTEKDGTIEDKRVYTTESSPRKEKPLLETEQCTESTSDSQLPRKSNSEKDQWSTKSGASERVSRTNFLPLLPTVDEKYSDECYFSPEDGQLSSLDEFKSEEFTDYKDPLVETEPSSQQITWSTGTRDGQSQLSSYERKKENVLNIMQAAHYYQKSFRGIQTSTQTDSGSFSLSLLDKTDTDTTNKVMNRNANLLETGEIVGSRETSSWTTGLNSQQALAMRIEENEESERSKTLAHDANVNKNIEMMTSAANVDTKNLKLLKTLCVGQSRLKIYGNSKFCMSNPVCGYPTDHSAPIHQSVHSAITDPCPGSPKSACSCKCRAAKKEDYGSFNQVVNSRDCASTFPPSIGYDTCDRNSMKWPQTPKGPMEVTGNLHSLSKVKFPKSVRFSESTLKESFHSDNFQGVSSRHDICPPREISVGKSHDTPLKEILNFQIQKFMESTKWTVTRDSSDINIDWGLNKKDFKTSSELPQSSKERRSKQTYSACCSLENKADVCSSLYDSNMTSLVPVKPSWFTSSIEYNQSEDLHNKLCTCDEGTISDYPESNIIEISAQGQIVDKYEHTSQRSPDIFKLEEFHTLLESSQLYPLDSNISPAVNDQDSESAQFRDTIHLTTEPIYPEINEYPTESRVHSYHWNAGVKDNVILRPSPTQKARQSPILTQTHHTGLQYHSDFNQPQSNELTEGRFTQSMVRFCDVPHNQDDSFVTAIEDHAWGHLSDIGTIDSYESVASEQSSFPMSKAEEDQQDADSFFTIETLPEEGLHRTTLSPLKRPLAKRVKCEQTSEEELLELRPCEPFSHREALEREKTDESYLKFKFSDEDPTKPYLEMATKAVSLKVSLESNFDEFFLFKSGEQSLPSRLAVQKRDSSDPSIMGKFSHLHAGRDSSSQKERLDNRELPAQQDKIDKRETTLFKSSDDVEQDESALYRSLNDRLQDKLTLQRLTSEYVKPELSKLHRRTDDFQRDQSHLYRSSDVFEQDRSTLYRSISDHSADDKRLDQRDPSVCEGLHGHRDTSAGKQKLDKRDPSAQKDRLDYRDASTHKERLDYTPVYKERLDKREMNLYESTAYVEPDQSSLYKSSEDIQQDKSTLHRKTSVPSACEERLDKRDHPAHKDRLEQQDLQRQYRVSFLADKSERKESESNMEIKPEKVSSHFSLLDEGQLVRLRKLSDYCKPGLPRHKSNHGKTSKKNLKRILSDDPVCYETYSQKKSSNELKPVQSGQANRISDETKPDQSFQARRLSDETKLDQSGQAKRFSNDTKPDQSSQARRFSDESKPNLSSQTRRFSDETKPDQSSQARRFSDESKPDQSSQTRRFSDERKPDQSFQTRRFSDETKPDHSSQARRFSDESKPDLSIQTRRFSDESKPDQSSQTRIFSDENKPDESAQARRFSDETKSDQSVQARRFSDETKPDQSSQTRRFSDETKPDQLAQARRFSDESKMNLSSQTRRFSDETKPGLSAQAFSVENKPDQSAKDRRYSGEIKLDQSTTDRSFLDETKPDHSAQAQSFSDESKRNQSTIDRRFLDESIPDQSALNKRFSDETNPHQSIQARRFSDKSKPDQSSQTRRFSDEIKQDQSTMDRRFSDESKPDQSSQARRFADETKPDQSSQARRFSDETKSDQSVQARRFSDESKPDLSIQTRRFSDESKSDQSVQARRFSDESKPDLSIQTRRFSDETKSDQSVQARRFADETKPDQSSQARRFADETKPDQSTIDRRFSDETYLDQSTIDKRFPDKSKPDQSSIDRRQSDLTLIEEYYFPNKIPDTCISNPSLYTMNCKEVNSLAQSKHPIDCKPPPSPCGHRRSVALKKDQMTEQRNSLVQDRSGQVLDLKYLKKRSIETSNVFQLPPSQNYEAPSKIQSDQWALQKRSLDECELDSMADQSNVHYGLGEHLQGHEHQKDISSLLKRSSKNYKQEQSNLDECFSGVLEPEQATWHKIPLNESKTNQGASHTKCLEKLKQISLCKRKSNYCNQDVPILHRRTFDDIEPRQSSLYRTTSDDDVQTSQSTLYRTISDDVEPHQSTLNRRTSDDDKLRQSILYRKTSGDVEPPQSTLYRTVSDYVQPHQSTLFRTTISDDVEPQPSTQYRTSSDDVEPCQSAFYRTTPSDDVEPRQSVFYRTSTSDIIEPLNRATISDDIEVHPSTLCRATSDAARPEQLTFHERTLKNVKPGQASLYRTGISGHVGPKQQTLLEISSDDAKPDQSILYGKMSDHSTLHRLISDDFQPENLSLNRTSDYVKPDQSTFRRSSVDFQQEQLTLHRRTSDDVKPGLLPLKQRASDDVEPDQSVLNRKTFDDVELDHNHSEIWSISNKNIPDQSNFQQNSQWTILSEQTHFDSIQDHFVYQSRENNARSLSSAERTTDEESYRSVLTFEASMNKLGKDQSQNKNEELAVETSLTPSGMLSIRDSLGPLPGNAVTSSAPPLMSSGDQTKSDGALREKSKEFSISETSSWTESYSKNNDGGSATSSASQSSVSDLSSLTSRERHSTFFSPDTDDPFQLSGLGKQLLGSTDARTPCSSRFSGSAIANKRGRLHRFTFKSPSVSRRRTGQKVASEVATSNLLGASSKSDLDWFVSEDRDLEADNCPTLYESLNSNALQGRVEMGDAGNVGNVPPSQHSLQTVYKESLSVYNNFSNMSSVASDKLLSCNDTSAPASMSFISAVECKGPLTGQCKREDQTWSGHGSHHKSQPSVEDTDEFLSLSRQTSLSSSSTVSNQVTKIPLVAKVPQMARTPSTSGATVVTHQSLKDVKSLSLNDTLFYSPNATGKSASLKLVQEQPVTVLQEEIKPLEKEENQQESPVLLENVKPLEEKSIIQQAAHTKMELTPVPVCVDNSKIHLPLSVITSTPISEGNQGFDNKQLQLVDLLAGSANSASNVKYSKQSSACLHHYLQPVSKIHKLHLAKVASEKMIKTNKTWTPSNMKVKIKCKKYHPSQSAQHIFQNTLLWNPGGENEAEGALSQQETVVEAQRKTVDITGLNVFTEKLARAFDVESRRFTESTCDPPPEVSSGETESDKDTLKVPFYWHKKELLSEPMSSDEYDCSCFQSTCDNTLSDVSSDILDKSGATDQSKKRNKIKPTYLMPTLLYSKNMSKSENEEQDVYNVDAEQDSFAVDHEVLDDAYKRLEAQVDVAAFEGPKSTEKRERRGDDYSSNQFDDISSSSSSSCSCRPSQFESYKIQYRSTLCYQKPMFGSEICCMDYSEQKSLTLLNDVNQPPLDFRHSSSDPKPRCVVSRQRTANKDSFTQADFQMKEARKKDTYTSTSNSLIRPYSGSLAGEESFIITESYVAELEKPAYTSGKTTLSKTSQYIASISSVNPEELTASLVYQSHGSQTSSDHYYGEMGSYLADDLPYQVVGDGSSLMTSQMSMVQKSFTSSCYKLPSTVKQAYRCEQPSPGGVGNNVSATSQTLNSFDSSLFDTYSESLQRNTPPSYVCRAGTVGGGGPSFNDSQDTSSWQQQLETRTPLSPFNPFDTWGQHRRQVDSQDVARQNTGINPNKKQHHFAESRRF